ncbi:MAG: SGNH/GDSL hydrolase family protein [Acidimicrobiia bacterium]|nr:SGNH/GDSL hydrolase family protein [Acidimicrobiia bacterium]
MRRLLTPLIGTFLVLGVAVGPVSAANSRGSARAVGDSTATAKPKKDDKYVALGSSIASGFGISVQSTGCGRSSRDYGQLVAARYKLDFVDVTCGAAVISHVVDTPQGENPPQITAVTPDTKLITVSVGGNDIVYNGTAVGCGSPANICTGPPDLDAKLASARTALGDMLDQLEAAAPKATIVFVTYPREVPRTGNCPELSFTDDEAEIVRALGEKLEEMFVEVAKRPGIVFVDPYVARGDHTGCAPASQQWTAGNIAEDGFAYHPTALGHQVMAKMIIKALNKK